MVSLLVDVVGKVDDLGIELLGTLQGVGIALPGANVVIELEPAKSRCDVIGDRRTQAEGTLRQVLTHDGTSHEGIIHVTHVLQRHRGMGRQVRQPQADVEHCRVGTQSDAGFGQVVVAEPLDVLTA